MAYLDCLEAILLPFMKKANQVGVIVKDRAPDEKPEDSSNQESSIESIASDLIKAVARHDVKTVAILLQEAHDCCAKPKDEDSEESHDFDSMNEQASKEQE